MGSVIDYIECPNCKQEAFSDFYYKTGEEYVRCGSCGYFYEHKIKTNDENGEFITKDGTDNYNFDNLIWETEECTNPFGAYKIVDYNMVGYGCGTLFSEEEYNNFKQEIKERDKVQFCSISRFTNGEIVEEIIVDNEPIEQTTGSEEEGPLPF